jgi:hypothetical protein
MKRAPSAALEFSVLASATADRDDRDFMRRAAELERARLTLEAEIEIARREFIPLREARGAALAEVLDPLRIAAARRGAEALKVLRNALVLLNEAAAEINRHADRTFGEPVGYIPAGWLSIGALEEALTRIGGEAL